MDTTGFESSWREVQLETLLDLSLDLVGIRSEEELARELLHRAVGTLDARAGFVSTEWAGTGRGVAVSLGLPGEGDSLLGMLPPPVRERLERGETARSAPAAGTMGIGELLLAPMRWQGRTIGVVALADKEERGGARPFDDGDARFLTTLATLGAAGLMNLRTLLEMERERQRLEEENRSLREAAGEEGFIGTAPPVRRVLELARRAAAAEVGVMIRGESGVGKERLARLIHELSPRATGPFVPLDCAAMPESLLEAELFGIEEGVATGVHRRLGKLELASGGTLFLDEIGDLPLALQAKLLRVVQEHELERVGGRERIPLDLRILTATNRPLEEMVEAGTFRRDLYYRLRVVVIELPPLRKRREDIPLLARHFLTLHGARMGRPDVRIDPEAMTWLVRRPFPGNIRELENLIQAAVALTDGDEITRRDLELAAGDDLRERDGHGMTLREVERRHILAVLESVGGRRGEAARILGIDRTTLYRKLRQIATHDATRIIS